MASVSRFRRSLLAVFSSCDIAGVGDGPPLGRSGTVRDGSMLASSARGGLRMDEIAFDRSGTEIAGAEGASSGSIVALRLRFLGGGAPGCIVGAVREAEGWDVVDMFP